MTSAPSSEIDPEVRTALKKLAEKELVRRSFLEFLTRIQIQGDDPLHPEAFPFVPYGYQLERAEAWERHTSEVILKARQLGFSWLLAALKYWRAAYHGWAVGYYSRGEDEAKHQLNSRVLFIHQHLPGHLQVQATKSDTLLSFRGGGSIRVFPSTEHSGVGYTFQLIVADELSFHPYGGKNYAAYQPAISAGGQFVGCSTANPELGPAGFFHDLYWDARRGENEYQAVFVPWFARPGRDEEWLERMRRSFKGIPQAFDAFYPATEAAAFVGRTGLVYPNFSKEKHVCDPPVPWERTDARYWASDYGGGDPSVVMVGAWYTHPQTWEQRLHIYDILYRPPASGPLGSDAVYQYLKPWHTLAPFTSGADDPKEGNTIADLQVMGLPANKANNTRSEGFGLVSSYLEDGWVTFSPHLDPVFREFALYRWKWSTDPNSKDRYVTGIPGPTHGDTMDTLRYLITRAHQDAMTPEVRYIDATVRL